MGVTTKLRLQRRLASGHTTAPKSFGRFMHWRVLQRWKKRIVEVRALAKRRALGSSKNVMKYPSEWNPDTKFLEAGATDTRIAACLEAAGFSKYLLVCRDVATASALQARAPEFASQVAAPASREFAALHNANVLILSGNTTRYLWKYRKIRHVTHVLFSPDSSLPKIYHLFGWLFHLLVGHYAFAGIMRCGAGDQRNARWVFVSRIRRQKNLKQARRYIPHTLHIDGFFERANRLGLGYAILRWFENLPSLRPDEDIDVLVRDEDLVQFEELLDEGPGTIPLDLYTVSGLGGTQYRKMAYYTPHLAKQIIEEAERHKERFFVPKPEHHFLSLAYHALYHKGSASRLPSGMSVPAVNASDHDYSGTLSNLATMLGLDVEISMESLDAFLEEKGWRPPLDTLSLFAVDNTWVAHRIKPELSRDVALPGLSCFVIRRLAVEAGYLDAIVRGMCDAGFDIVRVKELNNNEVSAACSHLRGGNWIQGSWNHTWDPPAVAIAAYSFMPLPPSARQLRRFPNLSDARLLFKEKLREQLTQHMPASERINLIHSSDNPLEAENYIKVLFTGEVAAIEQDVRKLIDEFATKEEVVETLTRRGLNAKIELIRYKNGLAIKKTFRPGRKEYLERELAAIRDLGSDIDAVPQLLATRPNALILSYYTDKLQYKRLGGRMLPRDVGVRALKILRRIYESGYAHLDAHPENFLLDEKKCIKLLDYEYSHRYAEKPQSFEASWDMQGYPCDFSGPVPRGPAVTFDREWKPSIGLSLKSALSDPPWLQMVKRSGYVVTHAHRLVFQRFKYWRRSRRTERQSRRVKPAQELALDISSQSKAGHGRVERELPFRDQNAAA